MEQTFFNNLTSNYEMFFTPAGSCQMDGIVSLYNYIMSYLTGILCVVTTALVFIIVVHLHGERHIKQFREEENLDDLINWIRYLQRWTHSTILELVWTIIPTVILIAIAIPSFILLYSLDEIVDTQSVVKIIGYQWYWKYEYPVMDTEKDDVIIFSYLSYMLPFDDLTEEKNWRLLEVDAPLVLPTNVNSKLVITAKDVLHSFAVPALGIKMDAVPGWLNQVTVHIFKSGMFYGQCSELCGVNHGFMPIVVAAVDFSTFEYFLAECAGLNSKTEILENVDEPSVSNETEIPNNHFKNYTPDQPVKQFVSTLPILTANPDIRAVPICIPCLGDSIPNLDYSHFDDLRLVLTNAGWAGTDDEIIFIKPYLSCLNEFIINEAMVKNSIQWELDKGLTPRFSKYESPILVCEYFTPGHYRRNCNWIPFSEDQNPIKKLLIQLSQTSYEELVANPSISWEEIIREFTFAPEEDSSEDSSE